jgi:hypothetical protein
MEMAIVQAGSGEWGVDIFNPNLLKFQLTLQWRPITVVNEFVDLKNYCRQSLSA